MASTMSLISGEKEGRGVAVVGVSGRARSSGRHSADRAWRDEKRRTAESARLAFFCVVQAARPINRHIRRAVVEPHRAVDRRPRVRLTEAKEIVKDGAIRELAAIDWRWEGSGERSEEYPKLLRRAARTRHADAHFCICP